MLQTSGQRISQVTFLDSLLKMANSYKLEGFNRQWDSQGKKFIHHA